MKVISEASQNDIKWKAAITITTGMHSRNAFDTTASTWSVRVSLGEPEWGGGGDTALSPGRSSPPSGASAQ